MTYIEFFDKNATENIIACLAKAPDRVVLIGSQREVLIRQADLYAEFFEKRGQRIEFIPKAVDGSKLSSIVKALSQIIEEYPDCVIDLTGGDDLYLVAVGIVSEMYKERHLQMHRFNVRNGTVEDCDQDGVTVLENKLPDLTVEDNIRIYGGEIRRAENAYSKGTYSWDMNYTFINDIKKMWDVCKKDVRKWNTQINVFQAASACQDEKLLELCVPVPRLQLQLKNKELILFKDIVSGLMNAGVLRECTLTETEFKITFKNSQVKKCLIKAGQVLEMVVFYYITEAVDNKNRKVYNDVLNGVSIDWDGVMNVKYETENEIDVVMMRGIWPIFVSCKNGAFDANELYKLNTVANRFGGKYAKKVLIATALESLAENANYIRQRAADMEIILIEDIQDKDEKGLLKLMAGLKSR